MVFAEGNKSLRHRPSAYQNPQVCLEVFLICYEKKKDEYIFLELLKNDKIQNPVVFLMLQLLCH